MKKITEKKERSLGVKLFLKADRCNSPKCVMVRRPTRPGQHGQRRHNVSEYGKQLQEKQKIQFLYGLSNRQMAKLFQSSKDKEKIMQVLEHRLDRVVFLLGFTGSPRIARQLISHGHIMVNGRKVTVPSFHVKIGDVISIRPESQSLKLFEGLLLKLKKYSSPEWLKLFPDEIKGECVKHFTLGQASQLPFDVNIVGEFYSR